MYGHQVSYGALKSCAVCKIETDPLMPEGIGSRFLFSYSLTISLGQIGPLCGEGLETVPHLYPPSPLLGSARLEMRTFLTRLTEKLPQIVLQCHSQKDYTHRVGKMYPLAKGLDYGSQPVH